MFNGESHQVGQEQKETAAASGKAAGGQREAMDVGDGLNAGTDALWPLLIEPTRKRSEALGLKNLAHP